MSSFNTFLEYYRNNEVKLNESPMRIGRSLGEDLDNSWYNVETSKEIINSCSLIDNECPLNTVMNLYRDEYSDNKIMDHWVTEQPFIGCYYIFQNVDGGLQSLGVWNHQQYKGSARILLFSYYLKKYDFIISDNKHTTQGETFWKNIIKMATKDSYKVTVLGRTGKEFDIDDVDSYWGNRNEFADYKIKIYKK